MRKAQQQAGKSRRRAKSYHLQVVLVIQPVQEPVYIKAMPENSPFTEICRTIYLWILQAWGQSQTQSPPGGRRPVGLLRLELVFSKMPRRQASDEWRMLEMEIRDRVSPVLLGTDCQPQSIDLPFVRGTLTFQPLTGLDAAATAVEESLAGEQKKTDNEPLSKGQSSSHEDLLPSPDPIEALFSGLSGSPEERRKEVVRVVQEVARKGVACLSVPPAPIKPETKGSLDQILLAALPENYTDHLQVLTGATRVFRNEAVLSVLSALDHYLATHEPQEKPHINNPIQRRKDLIRQKEELAEAVSGAFNRLGLILCCPSGKPGSLKVLTNENNPKGQFRLIPRGTGQAEKVRARLRDLLPFLHFEGADAHWESPDRPETLPSVSRKTSRGR